MQPRRRLCDVTLTGWRRHLRRACNAGIAGLAALAFVLLVFERHRRDQRYWDTSDPHDWGPWHSFVAETAFLPLIGLGLTVAAAWWARRSFPRAIVPGLLAAATSFGTFALFVVVHLFDEVDANGAMDIALILQAPLFFLGLVQTVAEPVLPILERRRLERDEDPVFPTARLVA